VFTSLAATFLLAIAPVSAVRGADEPSLAASAADSGVSASLRELAAAKRFDAMRWPDVSDARAPMRGLYEANGWQPLFLDSLGRPVQALVLALAAVVAGAAVLRLRHGESGELRGWLRWIAIGLVTIAAAYFMFLGSHLHPRDPGIDTRINLFAGLGYCILVYALLAAASELLLCCTTTVDVV